MSIRIGRRGALKGLAAGAAALAAPGLFGGCAPSVVRGRGARRPNIVFIMTDDHAQSALGVYGNRILKTPNLDRIGNEGLRFEQAFVVFEGEASPLLPEGEPQHVDDGGVEGDDHQHQQRCDESETFEATGSVHDKETVIPRPQAEGPLLLGKGPSLRSG